MSWFASHPFHNITVVALKLHRQRPRIIHLILEVINTQMFKKKQKKKQFTFQHLILCCFSREKKSTDYKIRAQHCSCTLSPGQLVAFATAHLWYFLPLLS